VTLAAGEGRRTQWQGQLTLNQGTHSTESEARVERGKEGKQGKQGRERRKASRKGKRDNATGRRKE